MRERWSGARRRSSPRPFIATLSAFRTTKRFRARSVLKVIRLEWLSGRVLWSEAGSFGCPRPSRALRLGLSQGVITTPATEAEPLVTWATGRHPPPPPLRGSPRQGTPVIVRSANRPPLAQHPPILPIGRERRRTNACPPRRSRARRRLRRRPRRAGSSPSWSGSRSTPR